jgi:hypothetical protein
MFLANELAAKASQITAKSIAFINFPIIFNPLLNRIKIDLIILKTFSI